MSAYLVGIVLVGVLTLIVLARLAAEDNAAW